MVQKKKGTLDSDGKTKIEDVPPGKIEFKIDKTKR
jgi:hypothetical protein